MKPPLDNSSSWKVEISRWHLLQELQEARGKDSILAWFLSQPVILQRRTREPSEWESSDLARISLTPIAMVAPPTEMLLERQSPLG
jgi:hypothetical protein